MKYSGTRNKGIVTLTLLWLWVIGLQAQCDTGCDVQCISQVNLSLGETCETVVTPWMGGVDIPVGSSCYEVAVYDEHNHPIPDNLVGIAYLNDNLTYKVTELECGNYCWGKIRVEYKLAPQIDCPEDITIACNALEYLCLPKASGGCSPYDVRLVKQTKTDLNCHDLYNGVVRRLYEARDGFGNYDTCSHLVWLKRIDFHDITFPPNATISCSDTLIQFADAERCNPIPWYLDPGTGSGSGITGYGHGVPILNTPAIPADLRCVGSSTGSGTSIPLIPYGGGIIISKGDDPKGPEYVIENVDATHNSAICNAVMTYVDVPFPPINGGCKKKIARTWEVREWWCTDEYTAGGLQLIVIEDDAAPYFECPPDQTVSTGYDCASNIYLPAVNPVDRCGEDVSVKIEYHNGFVDGDGGRADLKMGHNILTYRVSDNCGNQASCKVHYHLADLSEPVAVCESDKVVSISTNDNTLVPAEVFDNGSRDDCGMARMEVARMTNGCNNGITFGSVVKISATYSSAAEIADGGTAGAEIPLEAMFDLPDSVLHHSAFVTPNPEFEDYAGLYTIDISEEDKIYFNKAVNIGNKPSDMFNGILAEGSFIRYNLNFPHGHGITNAYPNDPNVEVVIHTKEVIKIILKPGFDFDKGNFKIDMDRFGEYVQFCCEDVFAQEVMVLFRVVDHSGNSSMCMVSVEVQDKAVPNLSCPPDMTIDCQAPYDHNNMDATFGSPSLSDNCPSIQLPNVELEEDMNQCGVGTMTRVFKLFDADSTVLRTCKQVVTVINSAPFTGTSITWPLDFEMEGCQSSILTPDQLAPPHDFPTYYLEEDQCALIGYDYDDKVFEANVGNSECSVISRTWKVINWCNSVEGSFDIWESPTPQLIKLKNTVSPELDDNSDILIESNNPDCTSGEIVVIRNATDDCTEQLKWEYALKQFPSGNIVQMGESNEIYGNFPVGEYIIEWFVHDGCGNFDSDVQKLNLINTKAPTPVCHNGLSATLTGTDIDGNGTLDTETVELWASDFNAGSYHNCGTDVTYSFSSDTTDKVIIFDCDDLGRQFVEMWVTDLSTGAQDFCIAFIDIQDEGMCPDAERVEVTGQVITEANQEIQGIEVNLGGSLISQMTNEEGTYAFSDMPMGGAYIITPANDTDYLNGVSTVDVIKIQRHILGYESLDSPYKLIAADVNNDQVVNGLDLVELRKLVLGVYSDLPMNTSWRFVKAAHEFVDPYNPWNPVFPEDYSIPNLEMNMDVDFIGVKIGDVNNSVDLSFSEEGVSKMLNGGLEFSTDLISAKEGTLISVPIYADNYQDISGWQGTFEYDQSVFEIVRVSEGEILPIENQINLSRSSEGWFTMSYNSQNVESHNELKPLFKVDVRVKKDISNVKAFELSSKVTKAEAYDSKFENIGLNFDQQIEIASISGISPNPWIQNTVIKIYSPYNQEARMVFYNVNGQLLKDELVQLKVGQNDLAYTRSQFTESGIINVRLVTAKGSDQYRMIMF